MRTALAWFGGFFVGVIVSVPARRAVIYYSEFSLPPKYEGPKVRIWKSGVEIVAESVK